MFAYAGTKSQQTVNSYLELHGFREKSFLLTLFFWKKECVECDLHKVPTDIVIIEPVWYQYLETIVLAPELYAQYHCL